MITNSDAVLSTSLILTRPLRHHLHHHRLMGRLVRFPVASLTSLAAVLLLRTRAPGHWRGGPVQTCRANENRAPIFGIVVTERPPFVGALV